MRRFGWPLNLKTIAGGIGVAALAIGAAVTYETVFKPEPSLEADCEMDRPHRVFMGTNVSLLGFSEVRLHRLGLSASEADGNEALSGAIMAEFTQLIEEAFGVNPDATAIATFNIIDGRSNFWTDAALGRPSRVITIAVCPLGLEFLSECRNANIAFYRDANPHLCDLKTAFRSFLAAEPDVFEAQ